MWEHVQRLGAGGEGAGRGGGPFLDPAAAGSIVFI